MTVAENVTSRSQEKGNNRNLKLAVVGYVLTVQYRKSGADSV